MIEENLQLFEGMKMEIFQKVAVLLRAKIDMASTNMLNMIH